MGLNSVSSASLLLPNSINRSNKMLGLLMQQLATNDKLVRPGLNPGLFVASERLNSQLRGLEAVDSSITFGRNITSLADASLSGINDQINNVKRMTLQAANFGDDFTRGTIQGAINQELQSISSQISRANFAGTPLFANGAFRTTDDTAGVLSNVSFTQTPSPVGSGINVDVTVNAVATQATTTLTAGGATTFDLGGSEGTTAINFAGGTSADLANQINASTALTGVTATDLGGSVQLDSSSAGADEFISVNNISGAGFGVGEAGQFFGTDADVDVNGVQAQAAGNAISFNQNGLTGSFNIDAATAPGTTTTTTIVGGGITLPIDASGSTMTFGVPAFSGDLGNSSGVGNLNTLATGGSNSLLSGNLGNQLSVLDSAANEVLAGRVQLAGVDSSLSSASNSIQSQMSSLRASFADLRSVDIASGVADLTRSSLQQEVQLMLLRRNNINQANVSRLLLGA